MFQREGRRDPRNPGDDFDSDFSHAMIRVRDTLRDYVVHSGHATHDTPVPPPCVGSPRTPDGGGGTSATDYTRVAMTTPLKIAHKKPEN